MEFCISTNQLYVADAYFGLSVAGPKGRLTTQLANGVSALSLSRRFGTLPDYRRCLLYTVQCYLPAKVLSTGNTFLDSAFLPCTRADVILTHVIASCLNGVGANAQEPRLTRLFSLLK